MEVILASCLMPINQPPWTWKIEYSKLRTTLAIIQCRIQRTTCWGFHFPGRVAYIYPEHFKEYLSCWYLTSSNRLWIPYHDDFFADSLNSRATCWNFPLFVSTTASSRSDPDFFPGLTWEAGLKYIELFVVSNQVKLPAGLLQDFFIQQELRSDLRIICSTSGKPAPSQYNIQQPFPLRVNQYLQLVSNPDNTKSLRVGGPQYIRRSCVRFHQAKLCHQRAPRTCFSQS